MKEWLDTSLVQVPLTSLTGKVLGYLVNQWSTLTVYCEDGRLEIDNNGIERAIRPFVIGRTTGFLVIQLGALKLAPIFTAWSKLKLPN